MALVDCPECGHPDISDTAEACPQCGYAIKEHFQREKQRKLQEENQRRIAEERQKEVEELNLERDKKLQEIDNLPYPTKPSLLNDIKSPLVGWTVGIIVGSFLLAGLFADTFIMYLCSLVCVVALVIGAPIVVYVVLSDYKSSRDLYLESTEDWEKYKDGKKEAIRKEYDEYASNITQYGTRFRLVPSTPQATMTTPRTPRNIPKCPTCGSTNVKRISDTKKATHAIAFGIYSKTAFSQFECEDCHYKW